MKLIEIQAAARGIDRAQKIRWRKIIHYCCRPRRDHGTAQSGRDLAITRSSGLASRRTEA